MKNEDLNETTACVPDSLRGLAERDNARYTRHPVIDPGTGFKQAQSLADLRAVALKDELNRARALADARHREGVLEGLRIARKLAMAGIDVTSLDIESLTFN